MQIDPSHAARDRRRKGKDVVHARLPLVVDRHNKRGAARLERVDGDGLGTESEREPDGEHEDEDSPEDHALHFCGHGIILWF